MWTTPRERESLRQRAGLLALGCLLACGPRPGSDADPGVSSAPVARSFESQAMGGPVLIRLVPGPADPTPAVEAALAEVQHLEQLLNLWSPTSTLALWNAQSGASGPGPLPLDGGLADLLAAALRVAEHSGGALDPTVGPVLRELGFYGQDPLPEPDPISWRARVGMQLLRLEGGPGRWTVQRDAAGLELDLSSLAKGAAADRAADLLDEAGFHNVQVVVGSSIVARGPGPGGLEGVGEPEGWPVVLAHPEGPWTWHLVDEALSTSGQSSLTLPGRQGSHLIDPRSLAPVAHGTEQVVVRGADGLTCDLWSTALLVLGRAAGERLLSGPTPPAGVTCALVYELPEPGEEPRPVLLEPQLR